MCSSLLNSFVSNAGIRCPSWQTRLTSHSCTAYGMIGNVCNLYLKINLIFLLSQMFSLPTAAVAIEILMWMSAVQLPSSENVVPTYLKLCTSSSYTPLMVVLTMILLLSVHPLCIWTVCQSVRKVLIVTKTGFWLNRLPCLTGIFWRAMWQRVALINTHCWKDISHLIVKYWAHPALVQCFDGLNKTLVDVEFHHVPKLFIPDLIKNHLKSMTLLSISLPCSLSGFNCWQSVQLCSCLL